MANSKASKKASKINVVAVINVEVDKVEYPAGTYFMLDRDICDKWEPKGYVQIVDVEEEVPVEEA